jgi:hypothetical protein
MTARQMRGTPPRAVAAAMSLDLDVVHYVNRVESACPRWPECEDEPHDEARAILDAIGAVPMRVER